MVADGPDGRGNVVELCAGDTDRVEAGTGQPGGDGRVGEVGVEDQIRPGGQKAFHGGGAEITDDRQAGGEGGGVVAGGGSADELIGAAEGIHDFRDAGGEGGNACLGARDRGRGGLRIAAPGAKECCKEQGSDGIGFHE